MPYTRMREAANFDDLFNWLDEHGPVSYVEFSRRARIKTMHAEHVMLRMEYAGYLLSEDENRMVYAFERVYP